MTIEAQLQPAGFIVLSVNDPDTGEMTWLGSPTDAYDAASLAKSHIDSLVATHGNPDTVVYIVQTVGAYRAVGTP